jgi:putative ABC transport system permease protein
MLSDYFSFAIRTFGRRPTRSWLTILGIFIGIAAVVSLISLGQGLQEAVSKQFERLGTDKVMIFPGSGQMAMLGALGGGKKFSDHDESVVEGVSGVKRVGGFSSPMATVKFKNEAQSTFVIGMPSGWSISDYGFSLMSGRDLKDGDSGKVVVGYLLSTGDFFSKSVKIGDRVQIEGQSFEVIGIVERIGSKQDDTQIYITSDALKSVFNEEGYSFLYVQLNKGQNTTAVAQAIKEKMRKDRGLKKGQEDFTVQTLEQLTNTVGAVIGVVQLIVISIAAISLIVGGIGIMNTMYTSVLERTREIGVMKAIGARNSDIMLIFLLESGLIGLVGGAIGVVLGVGGGLATEWIAVRSGYTLLRVSFPPWLLVGALAFSFFVGMLSGAIPASNAARMKPVEALRYE